MFVRFFSHRRQVREPEPIPPSPLAEHSLQLCHDVGFRARVADRNWVGQSQTGAYRIATPKLEESSISRGPDRARRLGFAWGEGKVGGQRFANGALAGWVRAVAPDLPVLAGSPSGFWPPSSGPILRLGAVGRSARATPDRPNLPPFPGASTPCFPSIPDAQSCHRLRLTAQKGSGNEKNNRPDTPRAGNATREVTQGEAAVGSNWRCRKRCFFFLFCCRVLLVWPKLD